MTINNQIKSFFYKASSITFSKCFFPVNPEYSKQAIKAHSIQNHGVLRELAEESHVIIINSIQDSENGPKLDFQKVGCNKATTFTGLCNEHDTLLFLPIDTKPIEISNQEHLFLLAYRSVLRELHAQCRNAIALQNFYINGVELGYFDHKEKDYPMMSATNWLLGAHGFYNFACLWGEVYLSQNFEQIQHQIIKIPNTKPTFAVSSVYWSLD